MCDPAYGDGWQNASVEQLGAAEHFFQELVPEVRVNASVDTTSVQSELPKNLLIWDSAAETSVFCNKSLFTSIGTTKHPVMLTGLNSDGAGLLTTQSGVTQFGPAYYHPKCIGNIVAQSKLVDCTYKVSYAADRDCFMSQPRRGGAVYEFKRTDVWPNLYTYSVEEDFSKSRVLAGVTTEAEVLSQYSKQDVAGAQRARDYAWISGASAETIIKWIKQGKVRNSSLAVRDVLRAQKIWGRHMGSRQECGKSTAHTTMRLPEYTVPSVVPQAERDITAGADIFFIDKVPYFITVFERLDYVFVKRLRDRGKKQLLKAIVAALATVEAVGFKVTKLRVDGEKGIDTEEMRVLLRKQAQVELEVLGEGEAVTEVERKIRQIKERVRIIWNSIPFLLTFELQDWVVQRAVYFINSEPTSNSEDSRSPREKVTGKILDEKIDFKYMFGEYVQVVSNTTDNSMKSRTQAAVALMPTGARDGSYYFMLLSSFVPVRRVKAWKQPMPKDAIQLINARALKQRSSLKSNNDIEVVHFSYLAQEDEGSDQQRDVSEESDHIDYINVDHDAAIMEGGIPTVYEDAEADVNEEEVQYEHLSDEVVVQQSEEQYIGRDHSAATIADIGEWDDLSSEEGDGAVINDSELGAGNDRRATADQESASERAGNVAETTAESVSDEQAGDAAAATATRISEGRYNLRPNRDKYMKWKTIMATIYTRTGALRDRKRQARAQRRYVNKRVAVNMSIKQALDKLGQDALLSIVKEVLQLHDRGTFEGVDISELSSEDIALIISSKTFLREKYSAEGEFEKLKARLVAGGHQQDRTV